MSFFDISSSIVIEISSHPQEMLVLFADELRSIGAEATPAGSRDLEFRIPFHRVVTRGYPLQGVSYGELEIAETDSDAVLLQYRLATVPMRWFCLIFAAFAMLSPVIAFGLPFPLETSSWALAVSVPVGALLGAFAYGVGRLIVRWKFLAFVRRSTNAAS